MTKSNLIITALFVLALIAAYSVYQPFLLSLMVAILLSMATFNLTKKLVDYTNSAHISASISTILLSLLLFAPIVYLATIGAEYIAQLDNAVITDTVNTVKVLMAKVPFLSGISEQYLNDEKIMENVMLVEPTSTGVRLSALFEQPREIKASIQKIDLLKNTLVLENQEGREK